MEKIDIYVPNNIGNELRSDASMFEIYKRDFETINMNRLLSLILAEYYSDYVDEMSHIYDAVKSALDHLKVSPEEKAQAAEHIIRNLVAQQIPSRKGKNAIKLSLKPTKDTEDIIRIILHNLQANDSISQYLCQLIVSYCNKPFSMREQILFKGNYKRLKNACTKRKTILINTIWNKEEIHEVIPYKVVVGAEEMYNYLLCAEINPNTKCQETRSYRLNRINEIIDSRISYSIEDNVKNDLDEMIKYGPQYRINSEEESCVRLSDKGETAYKRIYWGRPQYYYKEFNRGKTDYWFKCSADQLYLYFRRFSGEEAEVIEPESLREKIIAFHSNAMEIYGK